MVNPVGGVDYSRWILGFIGMKNIVIVMLAVASLVSAGSKVDAVNKNREGVAVEGYDVVAYFEVGRPVKGWAQHKAMWNGAEWWFASGEARDKFLSEPMRFAPQFGGYCAWAVSNNYTAEIEPDAWKIVDGKLYLNYNKDVRTMWAREQEKRIAAGERNWPGLHR